ncbi:MAG: class I SAM-dependent methyltransferase [Candidatus Paceibacterota bacterium]|jgi:SAM-dependent methyltransferase
MVSTENKNVMCGVCHDEKVGLDSASEKSGEYSLLRCGKYGVGFWYPMKSPGSQWYESDYKYNFRNKNPHVVAGHDHKQFLLEAPRPGGRILDIGMGTGNFLYHAQRLGYRVYGVDFDRGAIETAKDIFGLKEVYVGDVDFALSKWGRSYFDVITLYQVLEHVDDPTKFLSNIKELLNDGGYLSISVPDRNFWDKMKPGDKPPRHFTRWDPESLGRLLESVGYSVVTNKELTVPFWYLIKRFHFWTSGIFSFGLVDKVSKNNEKKSVSADGKMDSRAAGVFTPRFVKFLAILKDYILFSIPAIFLFVGLFLTGKHKLDLYVLARKDNSYDSKENL